MPLVDIRINPTVLRECMEEEGITQTELARALGIHKSTLTRVLNPEPDRKAGGKNLLYALQQRYPHRAQDLVMEHHEVAVTTVVSVESGG